MGDVVQFKHCFLKFHIIILLLFFFWCVLVSHFYVSSVVFVRVYTISKTLLDWSLNFGTPYTRHEIPLSPIIRSCLFIIIVFLPLSNSFSVFLYDFYFCSIVFTSYGKYPSSHLTCLGSCVSHSDSFAFSLKGKNHGNIDRTLERT